MLKMSPDWYYKPCPFNNLPLVQAELEALVYRVLPDYAETRGTFTYVDVALIKEHAPSYVAEIERLGLLDRWRDSAFVTTNGEQSYPIHQDCEDTSVRTFALNIPVLGCDNSWTVWYKANEGYADTFSFRRNRDSLIVFPDEVSTEVARMPATTCAFVNVGKPHRPVTEHRNFRCILTSRFWPELFDYMETYETV